MKRLSIILLSLLAIASLAMAQRERMGLVLSGGGAKGIAHIGFIQALEENDIPIDYVTGTSMGAIVGGLYACGYTPEEMMQLITSRGFAHWSTGRIDPELTYYFNHPTISPTMFSKNFSRGTRQNDSIAASIIPAMPMSYAFMELFSPYTAQCGGDFDKLFVPFRCVASDVDARKKMVMGKGDLGTAIRASMTFPIVFKPIEVNGKRLYDGGIYDNFPVDVMRDTFKPTLMLGVNVSNTETDNNNSLMAQIEKLVIQESDYTLPPNEGIKVNIDLKQFSLLDFDKALEIYQIGYDHAMANMDSIKSRINRRTSIERRTQKRANFKSDRPELRFEDVNVSGGDEHQNEFVEYLFHPRTDEDTIGANRARDAYYRAIASGKFHDLFPSATYNQQSGMFTLNLDASIKSGLKGSVGGFLSSATNTFIYGAVGYSTLSRTSLNTNLEAWIGQSNMAAVLSGRFYLHTHIPSAISVVGVASRERFYDSDHVFYDDMVSTSIANYEYFGKVAWGFAAGRHGAVDIGIGGASIRHTYDLIESDGSDRLRTTDRLAQAFATYSFSTLDQPNYPLSGHYIKASAMALIGRNVTDIPPASAVQIESSPKWLQLNVNARHYPALSKHITLGVEADVVLSTRKLLPTYSAAIAAAEQFCPTPSSNNSFRAELRSTSYAAAGLIPVWRINSSISARLGVHAFLPIRKIEQNERYNTAHYGDWISKPEIFSEADLCYHFSFGTLAGYVNYCSAKYNRWNAGISFGIYILPPKFLR